MKTRQGTSTPKFVRKTSQSPWDPSSTTVTADPAVSKEKNNENIITITPNKNVYTISNRQESTVYIRNSYLNIQGMTEKDGVRIGGQLPTKKENKVQQYGNSSEILKNTKNEMSQSIYLSIEKVNSLESLPTIRKKISEQFQNNYLQTKRKQSQIFQNAKEKSQELEIEKYKQSVSKLETENKNISDTLEIKKNQINKLILEISSIKVNSLKLETENINLRNSLRDLQSKFGSVKAECQNWKAQYCDIQNKKRKQQERSKELQFSLRRIELQISSKKQQIKQLNQIIASAPSFNPCAESPTSKAKIYSTPCSTYTQKCNRFVQTESSNYEETLKQLQSAHNSLKNKEKHIKNQVKQIHSLNKKAHLLEEVQSKQTQEEKLIEVLNTEILKAHASKLAIKYKYF